MLLPGRIAPEFEEALVALLRDRLAGLGPVSIETLSNDFLLEPKFIERAMTNLQNQGFAIAMPAEDAKPLWCERRLLARIHRYSREQRRHAVKPVPPAAFARFLSQWHGLDEKASNLDQALSQLEGWAVPVPLWEQSILGARCSDYSPYDLDQRFLSGELCWFKPTRSGGAGRQVVNATPIAIVPRQRLPNWQSGVSEQLVEPESYAGQVKAALQSSGAMFTRDIEDSTGLLRPHLEEALKSLVYSGTVTADAFSPLRWLLRPEKIKNRQQRRGAVDLPVGRWSLVNQPQGEEVNSQAHVRPSELRQKELAGICKALLRRYGVVFRAVILRESNLPPWRNLLSYFRRMEDRGEVRGGRFVDGFSGEQFALPEAVGLLRQCREPASASNLVIISAMDPLNLGGWIIAGPRTPSSMNNRVLLDNGLPVARIQGDEVEELPGISKQASARARDLLTIVRPWQMRLG